MGEPLLACTFRLERHWLGIDVRQVQEVVKVDRVARVPLAPRAVHGLINLRGRIVTAINLRARLGLPDAASTVHVVTVHRGEPLSLVVDEPGDVVPVDPGSIEPLPPTVTGLGREAIQGVCKLPNRLLLLLRLDTIADIPLEDRNRARADH